MAEEATKVEETIQEEVKQKLNNPLTDYLTKVSSEKKEEKKEEQQTQKKNYDYSFFKDIDDKDYKTIDDYLKENKIESDDVRYKIATLTNDFKKQQRMASQRLAEVEGLKSKLQSSEGASHKDFIDSLRKDPIGAFKRYKDEYDLPDFDFIQHQMESGGDIETRLEKWQNETLLKEIEKKFGIPADEFVFDPSEAKRANTPSRYYEKRTSQKEKELNDEFDNFQKKRKDADEKIVIERDKQLKELKETYFGYADDASDEIKSQADSEFLSHLQKLDEMGAKMKEGNFTADANPFAIKNIFRGVFYDELVKREVETALADLHQQYNKHGLYLPSNGSDVNDVTKMKGDSLTANQPDKGFNSPLNRTLNRFRN